jgi:diadenosine tetraphosphate (Ap4A) HIT family hydrolase
VVLGTCCIQSPELPAAKEKTALCVVVNEGKKSLDERITPVGYNVRINVGTTAGQTVMHCQIHLIPSRSGNGVNPRGVARGVIAGKADYERGG